MFLHIYSEASAAGHLKSCIFIFWVLTAFDAIGQHSLYQSFSSWTGNLPGISKMCGSIRAPSISQSMLPRPDHNTEWARLQHYHDSPIVAQWISSCLFVSGRVSFLKDARLLSVFEFSHGEFCVTLPSIRQSYDNSSTFPIPPQRNDWFSQMTNILCKGESFTAGLSKLKTTSHTWHFFWARLMFHTLVWWIFQKKNRALVEYENTSKEFSEWETGLTDYVPLMCP